MKNVFNTSKKVILMVAMMATVMGYANESADNILKDAKKTAITLNVKQGNLLTIKDTYGVILYKEFMKEEGVYTKGFDLSGLPNGDYTFELEKDVEIKLIPFTVISNKVLFNKNSEVSFFKPVTRVKNDLVYVSKLALNSETLDVRVFLKDNTSVSGEYNLVYSEQIENVKHLDRIYKLATKGDYKIVYHSNGRSFTEYINN